MTTTQTTTATLAEESNPSANPLPTLTTGQDVRLYARNLTTPSLCPSSTSGLAPTYLQANLIVLPSRYASDFRQLCARNPVPCPLLAESLTPGRWDAVRSHMPGLDGSKILPNPSSSDAAAATGFDIRRDIPKYNIYQDSHLLHSGTPDIVDAWDGQDHVAFLIGCSFSFESALTAAGLPPLHTVLQRNVPMYRTKLPLCPAGVFTGGTYVVSMRPYKRKDIEAVRGTTRPYLATHGEPVAWGWRALKELGIKDVDVPDWGDAPLTRDGRPLGDVREEGLGEREDGDDLVPVFWGCGVTPQEAVMRAGIEGVVMAHSPGHMLLLDCRDDDILLK